VLLDAVLDKTHDQHQAAAGREPGEALQDGIVGGADLIQAAARRHHGHRKFLQEVAAQGAGDRADDGVTENPKPCSWAALAAKCAPSTPVTI